MPRTCTVCRSDDRAEIDRQLVRGAAFRHIATRYQLSTGALQRHGREHIPKLLAAAEAQAAVTAAALLAELEDLKADAERIGRRAEKGGDLPTALRAVGERRGLVAVALKGLETVELEARLDALEEALPDVPKKIA